MNPYIIGLLGILALLFIILNTTHKASFLGIIGYTLLFFIGVQALTGNVTYIDGKNITAPCNCTIDSYNVSTMITTETNIYAPWDDGLAHTLGFILAIAGAFGFVITIFQLRSDLKGGFNG
jgi:hypothetical protein